MGLAPGISPEDMFLLNISSSINNQSSRFQADGFQAPTCSPLPRVLRVPLMFCFWLIISFSIFIYITQQKSPKATSCQETSKHDVSLWEHSPRLEDHLITILEWSVWKHFHQYDLSMIYLDPLLIMVVSVISQLPSSFPVWTDHVLTLCLLVKCPKDVDNRKIFVQIPPECTKNPLKRILCSFNMTINKRNKMLCFFQRFVSKTSFFVYMPLLSIHHACCTNWPGKSSRKHHRKAS